MTSRPAVTTLTALLCFLAGSPATTIADERPATPAERRMSFMERALDRFTVRITEASADGEATQPRVCELKAPLLRWSNPLEGAQDGVIGVFTSTGRPDVTIEFMIFQEDQIAQELTAITAAEIEVSRQGQVIWQPEQRWVSFRSIDNAPEVGATPARRMLQMRSIARRFRFVDHFGFDDENIQTNELRLIPKPIYRYSDPTTQVIDGGLFVYAIGTDPEAFLLIEAIETDEGRLWQYACAESSIYELEAFLDESRVWQKPRAKVFDVRGSTHFAGNYPKVPEDVSLEDAVP